MLNNTYVYLIQSGYTGPIKIGVAKDVNARLCGLQVGNPIELKLITSIGPFNRAKAEALEKQLHRKFKHKHVRGEWFSRTIDLSSITETDIDTDQTFPIGSVIEGV